MSETTARQFTPDYATPPGETLAEWLEEQSMTQAELATRAELSARAVNQIIHGVAPLSQDTALKLERVTGIPARIWNALEAYYREHLTRIEAQAKMAAQVEWLAELPVSQLRKLNIVTAPPKDKLGQVAELLRFFGVASAEAWRELWLAPEAAFRKSEAFAASPGAVAAWLRLGEIRAYSIDTEPFDAAALRRTLPALRELTRQGNPAVFVAQMTEKCAAVGVAVVFVPEIKGARCSGATRWTGGRPIVQLSLRHRSDDHLWFTFFHELGHILLHGRRDVFVEDGAPLTPEFAAKEDEANRFAREILIPPKFDAELPRLKSIVAMRAFADRIGIAPGIVVGRLQKDRIIGYRIGNKLKNFYEFTGATTEAENESE